MDYSHGFFLTRLESVTKLNIVSSNIIQQQGFYLLKITQSLNLSEY